MDNASKIIIIRNAYSYDFGGAERYPVFVAEALINQSFTPIVISRSQKLLDFAASSGIGVIKGIWWKKQSWNGTAVLLFPLYVMWQCILFVWYLMLFLKQRPLAVHIQSKDDFIAATFAARLVGSRVIWTDHADLKHIWKNLRVWYKNPVGKLVYIAAHASHAITLISQSEYGEVSQNLPSHSDVFKRVRIINNGSPDMKHQYPPHEKTVFTFCSTNRLVKDKGIGEMIDAFKIFHNKRANSKLVLVGNGPEENIFKQRARGVRNVYFVGYQSDPLFYVASSDVLLQPTYHEGFSISILEAFMLQKPVIATSVGGNVEMIDDGETGILIPVKDVDSLVDAMERLYGDKKLRDRLAKKAREVYVKRFVFDTIVKEQFIPLYRGGSHEN
jgi:glycosyltransferase involved in cell wall biosynthesis